MGLFLLVYASIRVANLSQAVQKVKVTADTPAYVRISKEPILAEKFLAGARPLVFPLYGLLNRNLRPNWPPPSGRPARSRNCR